MGKKDRQMLPQDKWKLGSPKEVDVQTNNMNTKNYRWWLYHVIWNVHNPEYCEMGKTGKDKILDSKIQEDGGKLQRTPF